MVWVFGALWAFTFIAWCICMREWKQTIKHMIQAHNVNRIYGDVAHDLAKQLDTTEAWNMVLDANNRALREYGVDPTEVH